MGNDGGVNLPKIQSTPQPGYEFGMNKQKKGDSSAGNVKGHIYTWPKSLKPELQKTINSIMLPLKTVWNFFKTKNDSGAKPADLKSKISLEKKPKVDSDILKRAEQESVKEVKELTTEEKLNEITKEIFRVAERREQGEQTSIENIDDKIQFLEEQIAIEKKKELQELGLPEHIIDSVKADLTGSEVIALCNAIKSNDQKKIANEREEVIDAFKLISYTLNAVRGERLQQYKKAFEEAGVKNKLEMSEAGVLKVVSRKTFAKKKIGTAAKELIKNIHQELFKELALIKEELEAIEKEDPNLEKTPMEKKTELEARLKTIEDTIKLIENNKWAQKVYISLKDIGGDFFTTEQLSGKLKETTDSAKTTFDKFTWQTNEQIINRLIDPKEPTFRSNILDSYRWLMTTEELFDKLITKFDSLDTEQSWTEKGEEKQIIVAKQQTIKNIIYTWLSDPIINSNKDLSDKTLDKISTIFGGNPPKQNKIDKSEPKTTTTEEKKSDPPGDFSIILDNLAKNKISNVEREQLLNQMADEIFKEGADLLKMIGADEFANQKWNKKDRNAPNILNFIAFSTKISNFVTSSIINKTIPKKPSKDDKMKERKQLLKFFIDLEEKCIERGDLSAAMAIHGGLSHSSLDRLFKGDNRQTVIDEKHSKKFEQSSILFSTESSSKNLREKTKALEKENKEYIPYVGAYLTDITFIDDGNPSENSKIPGARNIYKATLLAKAQRIITSAQKSLESSKKPETSLHKEINSVEFNEDSIYANSLQIQPRERSKTA